jgi:SpoVK/Ycf46/Vps4 family AAA+-type ATPase
MDPSVYRVICVEDIDIGFAQSKMVNMWDDDSDEPKTVQRKVGLAEILNCLDGVLAPQNTIFVFTTNHIEKLDPALIRPGRCDVKLEINGICLETLYKFCRYHYSTYETSEILWGIGEVLGSDEDIREDATFGELQTAVMKGASITEICKMIKKK